MEAKYPDTELRLYGSHDEMVLDLQAGRIDAIMSDVLAEDAFLQTPEGKDFAFFGAANHYDPAIHGVGEAVGVRKEDTALRDRFSAAIAAIRDSGTYEDMVAKYFSFDVYGE
jgi:ABC-type amino acid transport substrate-binding protein